MSGTLYLAWQKWARACHKLHESCGKGGKQKDPPLPYFAKTTRCFSLCHVISRRSLLPSPPPTLSSRCRSSFLKFHKHDSVNSTKPIMNEQCLPGLLAIFYKTSMLAVHRPSHVALRPRHLLPRSFHLALRFYHLALRFYHLAPRPSHPKPQSIRLNLHLNQSWSEDAKSVLRDQLYSEPKKGWVPRMGTSPARRSVRQCASNRLCMSLGFGPRQSGVEVKSGDAHWRLTSTHPAREVADVKAASWW